MDDSIQIIEDDVDDDNDEVIIIDNPRPKPPAPIVILFDSDDDDDNDDKATQGKEKINSINGSQDNTVELVNANSPKRTNAQIFHSNNPDSSCSRVNDAVMNNKNNRQMKDWYEKYASSNTAAKKSPTHYTCPECLAAFSSVYMIDRHITARHPKSIHRFEKSSNPCILHVLSDSESPSPQKRNEGSKLNQDKNNSTIAQRLKLTPLPVKRNINKTSDEINIVSDPYEPLEYIPLEMSPLSSKHSQSKTTSCTTTTSVDATNLQNTSFSSITRTISASASSGTTKRDLHKSAQPLGRISPLVSNSTANVALESSTLTRNPLTVVIFSPNNSILQERMVTVDSDNEDKTQESMVGISNSNYRIIQERTVQVDSNENERMQEPLSETNSNNNNYRSQANRMVKRNSINNYGRAQGRTKNINSNDHCKTQEGITRESNDNCKQGSMVLRNNDRDRAQKTIVDGNSYNDRGQQKIDPSDGMTPQEIKHPSSKELPKNVSKKRKRSRDPLLILAEDDSNEQNLPEKKLKDDATEPQLTVETKKFICHHCQKRFASFLGKKSHIKDKHSTKNNSLLLRQQPVLHASSNPPSLERLSAMKHIVMIDLDNWSKIFESDLKLSPSTFVWAFHGGSSLWRPPPLSVLLRHIQEIDCFYLHPKCGNSKDAADFALCVQAGKLDGQLPKEIPFTVLSEDKGFRELQNQLSLSKREVHIVNPHHKTMDTILTILNSIADK